MHYQRPSSGCCRCVLFRRRRCPDAGEADRADPQAGVPQILTLEGKFVRAAYNNEGYVILGYQASNRSIGDEWMLLEVGMTVREKTPDYRLTRDAISLETPDGKTIPLPPVTEQRSGNTQAIEAAGEGPARFHQLLSAEGESGVRHPVLSRPGISRAAVRRGGSQRRPRVCRPVLFQDPGRYHVWPALAQREVPEQPRARAFRILTEDEEKLLSKNYKSIEKQVKEAFAPKKKL